MHGIYWFRHDLRLTDNPGLNQLASGCDSLTLLYIREDSEDRPIGEASDWWLHHSLCALDASLAAVAQKLVISAGDAAQVLNEVISKTGATQVAWGRRYDPRGIAVDRKIKQDLRARGIEVTSFNSSLLFEPWQIKTQKEDPFRVFTPFWKQCRARGIDLELCPAITLPPPANTESISIDSLNLLPSLDWAAAFPAHWAPGEAGALDALDRFLSGQIDDYDSARDMPSQPGTSRLSPHLAFGEIGPRQIVSSALRRAKDDENRARFLAEIGWREFAYHLMFNFPHTLTEPMNAKFASFPWREHSGDLKAWQQGNTGIPLVDAGMRELWQTGWMHNRVRMIAASFLTKNLRIHWREGAKWFEDTLLDADLASNTMGWQWVAGSGADAAPYFRIFNPVSQGEKFDPLGEYVKKWVPELTNMPAKWIHQPWAAPRDVLKSAGVALGEHYPEAIADLQASRQSALEAYGEVKRHEA